MNGTYACEDLDRVYAAHLYIFRPAIIYRVPLHS